MRHQAPRNRTSRTVMQVAALTLIAVLIVVVLVRVKTHGISPSFMELVSSGPAGAIELPLFGDSLQAHVRSRCAGFWVLEDTLGPRAAPLARRSDRIEWRDNGIVWRVQRCELGLPGDSAVFMLVSQSFAMPYGWRTGRDSVAACDARVLRQVALAGADSCWGPDDADVVWDLACGAPLRLNGVTYRAYQGDIPAFFPARAGPSIEAIWHPLRMQHGYAVDAKNRTVRLNAPLTTATEAELVDSKRRCGPEFFAAGWALDRWAAAVSVGTAAAAREPAAVAALIDSVYAPLLGWSLLGWPRRPDTVRVTVALSIDWHGAVTEASVAGRPKMGAATDAAAVASVKRWRFPSLTAEAQPLRLRCTLAF